MHDHVADGMLQFDRKGLSPRALRLHLDNSHDARTSGWDLEALDGLHHKLHNAEALRLGEIEDAANLLAERMAAADRATVAAIFAPQEPVEAVLDALLADVEPMSFAGKAMFILDALAAAGYEVKKSAGPHLADRPGSGDGSAAVPSPAAPLTPAEQRALVERERKRMTEPGYAETMANPPAAPTAWGES